MYLTDLLIHNTGPILRLKINPSFNPEGSPKPLVLVGSNGSGKTSVLSIVADAMIELAASHFTNVAPGGQLARSYFRILSGRNHPVSTTYELAAARFMTSTQEFLFRSKSGSLSPTAVALEMQQFGPVASWSDDANEKKVFGSSDEIGRIFGSGVYAFFPSTRFELPHWANVGFLERDPIADFTPSFQKRLAKPIIVQTGVQGLKPWIIDVLLDRSIDAYVVDSATSLDEIRSQSSLFQNAATYENLNKIVSTLLGKTDARIVRLGRAYRERRICIAFGGALAIPTLDNLSSGQSSLLSIFGTILKYGDFGDAACELKTIEGIVLIDEIDLHLHADLQHEVLPRLIGLFPRVQFVVTSHAPLFLLGMRKLFGDDGFTLVELPSGNTINTERFTEFEASFAFYQATKAFETRIQGQLMQDRKPLVMCEGETDPKYLRTAAELLGMSDLAAKVDFTWVGRRAHEGAQGGGKDNLSAALNFCRNNPDLIFRRTVFVFDSDTQKPEEDHTDLFVRTLPKNPENTLRKGGVENLLPVAAFEDRFFEDHSFSRGDDQGTIRRLDKVALCDFLCDKRRNPDDFAKFRPFLTTLAGLLIPEIDPSSRVSADTTVL